MPDKPSPDPAYHAEDFSHRYADVMDYVTGDRMTELGIPTDKIGSRLPGWDRSAMPGLGRFCVRAAKSSNSDRPKYRGR
jgi:hypothetical protein